MNFEQSRGEGRSWGKKTDHFSKNYNFLGGHNYILKMTFIVSVLVHTWHSTQCRGQRNHVEMVHSIVCVLETEPGFSGLLTNALPTEPSP